MIGFYLIGREFYSFIFIQPTTLEVKTEKMRSKFIPEILLCPEPTFIMDAVIASGFKGIFRVGHLCESTHELNRNL